MNAKLTPSKCPLGLRVTLDGQAIELPGWLAHCLPAIQAYLEGIAVKNERVLWALEVNGCKVQLGDTGTPLIPFSRIHANTIPFEELSRHLIRAGRAKLKQLQDSMEEAALVVLINEAPVARRFWNIWKSQLEEPLFSLRVLHELNGSRIHPIAGAGIIEQYIDTLESVIEQVEQLLPTDRRKRKNPNILAFSQFLDDALIPWLGRVDEDFIELEALIQI
jgi:hypothetical protein